MALYGHFYPKKNEDRGMLPALPMALIHMLAASPSQSLAPRQTAPCPPPGALVAPSSSRIRSSAA